MKRDWSIIPEFEEREAYAKLAEEYHAGFEYNDFFLPKVYENAEEVKRRIDGYKALGRDRSKDTLHGAFLDVVVSSDDTYIAEYSKKRLRQSMEIAKELSVKGVIFHSGLVHGVSAQSYLNNWAVRQEDFYRELCSEYSNIVIYLENTQETTPELLMPLIERMQDCKNFKVCFDYAHAIISGTPIEAWVEALSMHVGHMHINDNDLRMDLHQVPGEGMVDWKQFKVLTDKMKDASVLIELSGLERQEKSLKYLDNI